MSIHGGSDSAPELAADIRAKVAASRLPRHRPEKKWVGPRSGKTCDGCERAITNAEREYEWDVPGGATIRLHHECLDLWHAARVKTQDATTGVVRDSPDRDSCGARLAAVLRGSAPAGYCVDCLAVKLSLSAHEVRGAAQVLVARPGFRVVKLACYTCGSLKDDVVQFAPRRPDQ